MPLATWNDAGLLREYLAERTAFGGLTWTRYINLVSRLAQLTGRAVEEIDLDITNDAALIWADVEAA